MLIIIHSSEPGTTSVVSECNPDSVDECLEAIKQAVLHEEVDLQPDVEIYDFVCVKNDRIVAVHDEDSPYFLPR
jgi:hypothetical protein